jgi:hypothetical protein
MAERIRRVLWAGDGAVVRPEVRVLPDAPATAIVNGREDWLQRKTTVGLSSGSLSRATGSPWRRLLLNFRGNTDEM